ncbi:MAG TPA: 50S ribosomal protein L29 [Spirochaetia bacterium]|nr:50S ribosomal protein L29 [Spirochaetia bacterium]
MQVYNIKQKYTADDLKNMSKDDLLVMLSLAQSAKFGLEGQGAVNNSKKLGIMPQPHLFKKIKKDIARIKTLLAKK